MIYHLNRIKTILSIFYNVKPQTLHFSIQLSLENFSQILILESTNVKASRR